MESKLGRKRF